MSSTGSSPSVPPVDDVRTSATATDERAPEESYDESAEESADHGSDPGGADVEEIGPITAERSAERRAERIRAARRRRDLLLGLVGLAVLSFVLALAVAAEFWIVHLAADVIVVGYVVRLRQGTVRRERREARLAARLRPTARALLDVEAGDRDGFSDDWRGQLGTRERPGARERAETLRARYEAEPGFAEAHTDRFAAIRADGYRVMSIDEDDPTFSDLDTYTADEPTYRSYGFGASDSDAYGPYGAYDTDSDGEYDEPYEPPKAVNG